jgi:alpha-L-rhamnosidase
VVGDHVLVPGWTSYRHRLVYQTFDVLPLLDRSDTHSVEVTVAEGWYCSRLGFLNGRRNIYGESHGQIAMAVLEYPDGNTDVVGTSKDWVWYNSPILESRIYDGETYDSRLTYAPRRPSAAERQPVPSTLCVTDGPPVRRTEELRPSKVCRSKSGVLLVDMFKISLAVELYEHKFLYLEATKSNSDTLRYSEMVS